MKYYLSSNYGGDFVVILKCIRIKFLQMVNLDRIAEELFTIESLWTSNIKV